MSFSLHKIFKTISMEILKEKVKVVKRITVKGGIEKFST